MHERAILPRPLMLVDRGCPFAHRVSALLHHLDVAYDSVEAPVGQLPEGLERWSPSGRIPLLVHGEVVVGESRVMLEHLAEAYAFENAYPTRLVDRTKHRHAMAVMDVFVAPWLHHDDEVVGDARLDESVEVLHGVTQVSECAPCLLAFHLAPLWLRFQWWRPNGAVTRAIRQRPGLAEWLDGAAGLAAVEQTCASRAESIAEFRALFATPHAEVEEP